MDFYKNFTCDICRKHLLKNNKVQIYPFELVTPYNTGGQGATWPSVNTKHD